MSSAPSDSVVLTKHHGLGNDFLVLDLGQSVGDIDWMAAARSLCDRRFGIGADGLLLMRRIGDRHVSMVLHNSDGSRAEMSGNGIRCLVQAAHMADGSPDAAVYLVDTEAGRREVAVVGSPVGTSLQLRVDMGTVVDLPAPAGWDAVQCHPDRPVRHVSLGNPHSVVGVDDVTAVDLADLGSRVPHVNLEIIEPGPEVDAITMRVHERGVGITLACGTGACAAAEAAKAWGLVPASVEDVLVHMEGGDARVRVDPATRLVTLTGPSVYVASVSVSL